LYRTERTSARLKTRGYSRKRTPAGKGSFSGQQKRNPEK
jgi:hypothetical protein